MGRDNKFCWSVSSAPEPPSGPRPGTPPTPAQAGHILAASPARRVLISRLILWGGPLAAAALPTCCACLPGSSSSITWVAWHWGRQAPFVTPVAPARAGVGSAEGPREALMGRVGLQGSQSSLRPCYRRARLGHSFPGPLSVVEGGRGGATPQRVPRWTQVAGGREELALPPIPGHASGSRVPDAASASLTGSPGLPDPRPDRLCPPLSPTAPSTLPRILCPLPTPVVTRGTPAVSSIPTKAGGSCRERRGP